MLTVTATRQRTDQGQFMRKFNDAVYQGMLEMTPMIREELVKAVGTQYYSLNQLKLMGHPYSVLNPNPPLPPGIINRQSGEFYRGMVITPPRIVKNTVTISVDSQSWKRDMLLHPSRMIARPYDIYLANRLNQRLPSIINSILVHVSRVR